jgi:hypothetical protein
MPVNPITDNYFFYVEKLWPVKGSDGKIVERKEDRQTLTFGQDSLKTVFDAKDVLKPEAIKSGILNIKPIPQSQQVLSFSAEEEEFGMLSVSLQIADFTGAMDKAFQKGQQYLVKWGVKQDQFKNFASTVQKFGLSGTDGNFKENEVKSDNVYDYVRGGEDGIKCFVTDSSFTIQGGVTVWSISLRGGVPSGRAKETKVYDNNQTLEDVIYDTCLSLIPNFNKADLLLELGSAASVKFTKASPIARKNITPVEFLNEIAKKYNLQYYNFYKGFKQCIAMVNKSKTQNDDTAAKRNLTGKFHIFDYGNGEYSNIIGNPSGSVQPGNNVGSIAIPVNDSQGKPALEFAAAPQEQTQQYVLKSKDALTQTLRSKGLSGQALANEVQRVVSLDFEDFLDKTGDIRPDLKQYFELKTFDTFPEGGGAYEFNCNVIPNPMYMIADKVWLGKENNSFPSPIPPTFRSYKSKKSGKLVLWRIAKITWEHNSGGVSQKILLKR